MYCWWCWRRFCFLGIELFVPVGQAHQVQGILNRAAPFHAPKLGKDFDIGIIDKGRLLEEESLEELEAKNGKYIRFILSDANRASNLLAYQFKARDCQILPQYRWGPDR